MSELTYVLLDLYQQRNAEDKAKKTIKISSKGTVLAVMALEAKIARIEVGLNLGYQLLGAKCLKIKKDVGPKVGDNFKLFITCKGEFPYVLGNYYLALVKGFPVLKANPKTRKSSQIGLLESVPFSVEVEFIPPGVLTESKCAVILKSLKRK